MASGTGSQRAPTAPQIAAFRLARHHLTSSKAADLAGVCRDVCGIQAQVMRAAQMSLWARLPRCTRAQIRAALAEKRTLVKTASVRGTLHLLAAEDFPLFVAALRRSRMDAAMGIMARFGITRAEADAMTEDVLEALSGGPLTNQELTSRIAPKVGRKIRRWMGIVWNSHRPAIAQGLICYGPERGAEVTFVRADQWLPRQKKFTEREAQQILIRRYLGAFGPATLRDFCHWCGIPSKDARSVWESLRDEYVPIAAPGHDAVILRQDLPALSKASRRSPVVRLLPNFDTYLLGHKEKGHLVEPRHYKLVFRAAGWVSPVLLVDGRVAGIWSLARRGQRASLDVQFFTKLARPVADTLEEEKAALLDFLGSPG